MEIFISSYGKLIKYNIITGVVTDLQTNGLYYGAVSNKSNIYSIFRPDKERLTGNFLSIIDRQTNSIIKRKIEGSHIHEIIFSLDKKRLFYISTNDGFLFELDLNNLEVIEKTKLGTRANHINTIAIKDNLLYTLYHNRGRSDIVVFDMSKNYYEVKKYLNIGIKCHNITFWKQGFLYLDSDNGQVKYFNETTEEITLIYDFIFLNEKKFLKGLLVLNNLLFVGVSMFTNRILRYNYNSEVGCINLNTNKLIFLKFFETNGIINTISYIDGHNYIINNINTISNIYSPGLNFSFINKKKISEETIKHIGYVPVDDLKKVIVPELWKSNIYSFNDHFQPKFRNDKPIILIFCNSECTKFYKTQYWREYRHLMIPLIKYIFGSFKLKHIGRLQFSLLRSKENINMHTDKNEWARNYKRIHIAINTNNNVNFNFKVGNKLISNKIKEGEIIEFNNLIPHGVINDSDFDRIHIIIDYSIDKIDEEYIKLKDEEVIKLN